MEFLSQPGFTSQVSVMAEVIMAAPTKRNMQMKRR
jgi:hypothetical protein